MVLSERLESLGWSARVLVTRAFSDRYSNTSQQQGTATSSYSQLKPLHSSVQFH